MTDLEEIILDCIHYTSTDLCKYEGIGWGKQNILRIKELVEELKDYRDKNKMVVRVDVENMDKIKDKINELSKYAENQYSNGIEDYKNKIKEELDRFEVQNIDTCVLYDLMDRKAERLKECDEE